MVVVQQLVLLDGVKPCNCLPGEAMCVVVRQGHRNWDRRNWLSTYTSKSKSPATANNSTPSKGVYKRKFSLTLGNWVQRQVIPSKANSPCHFLARCGGKSALQRQVVPQKAKESKRQMFPENPWQRNFIFNPLLIWSFWITYSTPNLYFHFSTRWDPLFSLL